jgi:hypothetical protein
LTIVCHGDSKKPPTSLRRVKFIRQVQNVPASSQDHTTVPASARLRKINDILPVMARWSCSHWLILPISSVLLRQPGGFRSGSPTNSLTSWLCSW